MRMTITSLGPAAAFVLGLFLCFNAHAQAKGKISVAGETVVNTDHIDLGMISSITADKDRIGRLSSISLGYSPGIGNTRELLRSQILLAVKAAGFAEGDFSLETPTKVVIRRASQTIPTQLIRDAVEKAVRGQFSDPRVSVDILGIDVPADIAVPLGAIDIKAAIKGVRSLYEKFPVPVEVRVDGKLIRTFAVSAEAAVYCEVLVAATDLTANKKLTPADVRMEKVRLEKPLTSYLRDPAVLRGVQMTRPLESGKPLSADSYTAAVVIKLGDPVRVEAQSGRMEIIVSGEACANGRIGDRISVKNKQTNYMMQAIVVDEGLVKLLF